MQIKRQIASLTGGRCRLIGPGSWTWIDPFGERGALEWRIHRPRRGRVIPEPEMPVVGQDHLLRSNADLILGAFEGSFRDARVGGSREKYDGGARGAREVSVQTDS